LNEFWRQPNRIGTQEVGVFLVVFILLASSAAHAQSGTAAKPTASQNPTSQAARTRYLINLQLDFDGRTYTGTERVRWVNRDDHPASVLYFHLYANMRAPLQRNASATASVLDEPRLEISGVRAVANSAPQPFSLDEQGTVLRVNLREAVAPNSSTEIEISFKGSVPEIDAEETGLMVHVLRSVASARCGARATSIIAVAA
jgi:aminopeptidase N